MYDSPNRLTDICIPKNYIVDEQKKVCCHLYKDLTAFILFNIGNL